MAKRALQLEASVDERTGHMRAAYLRVRQGKVARTKEIKEGVVYADYDASGRLLGIELLGPCDVSVLDKIAEREPRPIKQFLANGAPRELVVA
jgi:uncharacterized protein YuzE